MASHLSEMRAPRRSAKIGRGFETNKEVVTLFHTIRDSLKDRSRSPRTHAPAPLPLRLRARFPFPASSLLPSLPSRCFPPRSGCGTPSAHTASRRSFQLLTGCFLGVLLVILSARRGEAQLNWQGDWGEASPRVQVMQPATPAPSPAPVAGATVGSRRVRIFPRSSVPWNVRIPPAENGERVVIIDSGVNIVIDNVAGFDTVDISTDRVVIWTRGGALPGMAGDEGGAAAAEGSPSATGEDRNPPFEFYMEGNIVFRQQDRVIYAERMYYNVERQEGVVLDGELLTPIPDYQGLVRLKADVLRQIDPNHIEGYNGAVTTSRMGVPRYWLQAGDFQYESLPSVTDNMSPGGLGGASIVGPGRKRITSRNNRVYLSEVPVFYWPFLAADLDQPSFYLESIRINNDSVFGTQVLTDWNLYQLLGWRGAPAGTRWTGSVDYLSKRGLGLGSHFEYDRPSFLWFPGRTIGFVDAWGINDSGLDNLGLGRRELQPETDLRGRVLARHRQSLHDGWQFTGELGLISDRNFLEQYFEQEWDQEKDESTGVELKKTRDNHSFSITADVRPNDFFTQTEWLPRLDHFWIGQPILGDYLTWTEHSSLGYAQLRTADAPEDPTEAALFQPLAWEQDVNGVRATTRHRLDLPLQLGGAKIVPYVLGEAAYWGEDLTGNETTRLLGQVGIRGSIPFYRIDPTVQSTLFNVNGIAHKVVLESDLFYANSDVPMGTLPLYDAVDDDAIEFFRRRFYFTTFDGAPGGNIPLPFDERYYALRGGMQRWVTAPNPEIADDLMVWRPAIRQRWQTKRGLPGQQRVVDWITFDTEAFIYPDAERDNFGSNVGLLSYDLRWHVGDRFTVLSDAQADFFDSGMKTISLGGMISRPGVARYVAGVRSIEGPISSQIVYGSASYRLSQKWIANYGSTYDFGETGNIGQRGEIVRVGESFLVGLGFNYDSSRDNFGVQFNIEPRFLSGRMGRVGGVPIAPVGAMGLE